MGDRAWLGRFVPPRWNLNRFATCSGSWDPIEIFEPGDGVLNLTARPGSQPRGHSAKALAREFGSAGCSCNCNWNVHLLDFQPDSCGWVGTKQNNRLVDD